MLDMTAKTRYTLALSGRDVARMIDYWYDEDMPCDLRLRRAREKDVCCLEVVACLQEEKAVHFVGDVIRKTNCRLNERRL